jgi:hypothetical protein
MRVATLLSTLLVGGCGLYADHQFEERRKASDLKFQSELDACRKEGSPKAYAICWKAAMITHWREERLPHLDLIEWQTSEQVALAERFEAGKYTDAEFDAASARLHAEMTTQLQQRQNSEESLRISRSQAAAAWAASEPVTCRRVGDSVRCR